MQNSLLTSRLANYIEAMIADGTFAPGDRLPPLRELADQFGLTLSTARRSLKELCDKDILELRHGSGTYVKTGKSQDSHEYTISVVLFNKSPQISYCAYAMQRFQTMAVNYNWNLRVFFNNYNCLKQLQADNHFKGSDALVLMGCYDTFDLCYLPKHLPIIGLEIHTTLHGQLSPITLDPFEAAELAVEHFKKLGVRHVKILNANMPVHEARTAIFCHQWGENHEIIPENVDFKINTAYGYLFVSGSAHETLAQRYREINHCDLAELPQILSIDGKSLVMPDYRPSNTITIDWHKAGEAVAQECARRLNTPGSPARRIYIAPKLHLYNQQQNKRKES